MAEHHMIQRYNDVLRAELPPHLVEEIADGLAEANAYYLRQGLDADEAAQATVSEFGDARAVVEAFTRDIPARRIARRLIATGPVVGGCWAVALITGRAWEWPVPDAVRFLLGATLVASVSVLLTAALARRYRVVRPAGVVGCAGLAVLDLSAITAVVVAAPTVGWLAVLAAGVSASRLILVTRAVRPVLA